MRRTFVERDEIYVWCCCDMKEKKRDFGVATEYFMCLFWGGDTSSLGWLGCRHRILWVES